MALGPRRTARLRTRGGALVLGDVGQNGELSIRISVRAVGRNGTVPLGWALYLPEEWCEDSERRRKAKIPRRSYSKTPKPELAVGLLVERTAAGRSPGRRSSVTARTGKNAELRERLDGAELVECSGLRKKVEHVHARDDLRGARAAPRGSGRQKTVRARTASPSRSAS